MAQAELLKRQEELERKAAELDRREREMQSLSQHGSMGSSAPWSACWVQLGASWVPAGCLRLCGLTKVDSQVLPVC